ncbi:hypothetical protein [Phytohalomonas tamaricis]|uniref:hypothetical protein n=1 Tax=Phytohalomonas tamaricis TaxID=2081032 RepID=UPI000D0B6AC0|nr:hypothetical protein [Phytohalomonas tamaricis]
MYAEDTFSWLGEKLGDVIRFIVGLFSGVFGNLFGAIDGFVQGLTGSLGMSSSLLSLVALAIGLLFLYSAVRAFLRRAIVGGVIRLIIGMLVLSSLIN